ncbi:MAG: class I tRNA ligase family protein [Methanosarcinales archaeon]|nr:class I tRNA ligase family protein [Methanosarcinales archaeon]
MGLHVLSLYNSLTRQVEQFRPLKEGEVKMFTCGPSIYQRPHIGNYRTFLFEDVLQRYLEYRGYTVTRALNCTDVEEKSILEAKKHSMDVLELTGKYSKLFFQDLALLKIRPPTFNPRSSTSIDHAVDIIQDLLEKGYAYWYRGNVYFDPLKFDDFGKLGRPDLSRWPKTRRRFHRDTYPGNYWNLGDFILWHGYREADTVYWDTSIGRGRPAWNVQDPAMVLQTLGPSLDICCGGEDNMVRHHDYTIAIVESVTGKKMANYWLHGAHLLVDGRKMSKSKGNVVYPDDLLDAGYTAEEIRFFLLYGSYRKRLNFTYKKLNQTSDKLRQTCEMIGNIQRGSEGVEMSDSVITHLIEQLKSDFERNMDNDLDVKQAVDDLMHMLSDLIRLARNNKISSDDANKILFTLTNIENVLQILRLSGT